MRRPTLAIALVLACLGISCELIIENHEPTREGESTPDTDPPPQPEPTPDAGASDSSEFERPADCSDACCDACAMMAACTDSQEDFDACTVTCAESIFVPSNQVPCLALRIYWINEEGCSSIVDAYRRFDLSDNCDGPQP